MIRYVSKIKLNNTNITFTCRVIGYRNIECIFFQQTSDLKFIVEEKPIHAHKAILKIRSEHFRCMFNGKWEIDDSG